RGRRPSPVASGSPSRSTGLIVRLRGGKPRSPAPRGWKSSVLTGWLTLPLSRTSRIPGHDDARPSDKERGCSVSSVPARRNNSDLGAVDMTVVKRPAAPRMTVVGAGSREATSWRQALADGTATIAVGSTVAGGFLIEAGKSVMTGETADLGWFVLGCALGLAGIWLGWWQRQRSRRGLQIGVVVTATDTRRDGASGNRHDQQAEDYSLSTCSLTLKTSVELTDVGHDAKALIEDLADETLTTITIAERLSPGAARINLIP